MAAESLLEAVEAVQRPRKWLKTWMRVATGPDLVSIIPGSRPMVRELPVEPSGAYSNVTVITFKRSCANYSHNEPPAGPVTSVVLCRVDPQLKT